MTIARDAKDADLADQVMLFGTYDMLTDYRNSAYSLGFTAIWQHVGNRLRILFSPSQIIERCEFLGSKLLVLPSIFANQSIIDAAALRGSDVWIYGKCDERDLTFLVESGVIGLIVDQPQIALELFGDEKNHNSESVDNSAVDRTP